MADITAEDLAPVLTVAVGGVDLPDGGELGQTRLEDIGFDSLAILELLDAIKQKWAVVLSADAVDGSTRIAELAGLTNAELRQANAG